MDISQLKKMKRFRLALRFIGLMFCLVGGMLLITTINLLLDPESTIIYNGVVTNEFKPKLSMAIFNVSFVLLGLLCLFAPTKAINKVFVLRQSFLSLFSFKRKNT